MPGNRSIGNKIICGDFLIVGDDGEGGTISLTDDQITKYKEKFKTPMEFTSQQVEDNIYIAVVSFDEYYEKGIKDTRPKVEGKPFIPKSKQNTGRDR